MRGSFFFSGVGIINRIRNSNIPRTAWRRKNLIFFVTVTALIRMRASGPDCRSSARFLGRSLPGNPIREFPLVDTRRGDAPYVEEQLKARPRSTVKGMSTPVSHGRCLPIRSLRTLGSRPALPPEMEVPVTVPVVFMPNGEYVVASGEKQPGVRTTQVFSGTIARSPPPSV